MTDNPAASQVSAVPSGDSGNPGNPRDHLNVAELRHPDSFKWTLYPPDVIPMWVADMDYPIAPPVLHALQERLTRGVGYHQLMGDPTLNAQLRAHLATHGLEGLPEDGVSLLPGVVPGLYAAIHALTTPGEPVLTMTPVYHPFHQGITDLGRRVSGVPLREGKHGYEINWAALDAAARGTRLLMLCHPHNPTGRVWTHQELTKLRDLALARDLFVISDELHAELRFTGKPFEAFAADPRVHSRTITVTGPCKAYNTAGLGIGAMVGHNAALVKRVRAAAGGLMGHESALSVTMWQAALREGGPWLQDTLAYLKDNRDYLSRYLREHLPWIKFFPVEATYLAWLDLRAHPRAGDIKEFLLQEAKVAVHDGTVFADDFHKKAYQGFIRLNFATSHVLLHEALERMRDALTKTMP